MKIIKSITTPTILAHWYQDLVVTIPRMVCGYLLTVEFGSPKFGLPWSDPDNGLGFFEVAFWFPNDVASYGGIFAIAPAFFAWMGAFSEAIGGLLLIIGFQTRIASFLIVCTMLVAIFMQQINNGLWNCLPAMGFLWIGLFYTILGSGRFGLDYLLTKKTN
nr:DoxX family protein [uncultured Flavobacterium sp.]